MAEQRAELQNIEQVQRDMERRILHIENKFDRVEALLARAEEPTTDRVEALLTRDVGMSKLKVVDLIVEELLTGRMEPKLRVIEENLNSLGESMTTSFCSLSQQIDDVATKTNVLQLEDKVGWHEPNPIILV